MGSNHNTGQIEILEICRFSETIDLIRWRLTYLTDNQRVGAGLRVRIDGDDAD